MYRNLLKLLLWGSLHVILLGGCAAVAPSASAISPSVSAEDTLVTLYLEGQGRCLKNVSLRLERIELLYGDLWLPLDMEPVTVQARNAKDNQLFLGAFPIPAGSPAKARLQISGLQGAQLKGADADVFTFEIPVRGELALGKGASRCLFLEWQLQNCVQGGFFEPRFSLHDQGDILASNLLYAVCDDIDTLYLLRTDNHFVAGSVRLPGPLGEMQLDQNRQLLYVVSTGERALHVFDCRRHRIVERFVLPGAIDPLHVALSDDGRWAFVTDAMTNRVFRVDLGSGELDGQTTVGYRPGRIAYVDLAGADLLAISSPDSQQVYLLDAETFDQAGILPVGLAPEGLLAAEGMLYVCEKGSNTVAVYDLRDNRLAARIGVGNAPESLAREGGGKIYVANSGDSSLSVLAPNQFTALRRIPAGENPFSLLVLELRKELFVANREARQVTAIDLASERVLFKTRLGGTPFFLAVQE